MAKDSETRRLRYKQVGMLMRAYRHAYTREGTNRRLSQSGLLDLMGQVDPEYLDRHDHSTVARWESGARRPTRERLVVFGQALDLAPAEIDGLLRLAGLDTDFATPETAYEHYEQADADEEPVLANVAERSALEEDEAAPDAFRGRHALRYALSRFVLPSLCISLAGYFIATLGWNSSVTLALYAVVALSALLALGFWRLRRSDDLADLLFVTVFFLLSIHVLNAPLTRMDIYGLYNLGGLAGTSIPFTLSLIMNLLVATVAGLMFVLLRRWQYSDPSARRSVYSRAAWIVLPPIAFVYAFILAFANVGIWILGLVLLVPLAGAFITLVVLRDREVSIGEWDRKFLLCTTVAVVIVLSVIGLATILLAWMQPIQYPEGQGLFYPQDLDFDTLGYSASEHGKRSMMAVIWILLATFAYMVIVIAGKLIVTIYRLDGGDSSLAASAAAVATGNGTILQRTRRRSRLDLHHWAGLLSVPGILRLRGGRIRSPSGWVRRSRFRRRRTVGA